MMSCRSTLYRLTVRIYRETMHQDVLRKSFRRYEMQEGPAVFWETLELPSLGLSEPFPYPTPTLPVTSASVPRIRHGIVSPEST